MHEEEEEVGVNEFTGCYVITMDKQWFEVAKCGYTTELSEYQLVVVRVI